MPESTDKSYNPLTDPGVQLGVLASLVPTAYKILDKKTTAKEAIGHALKNALIGGAIGGGSRYLHDRIKSGIAEAEGDNANILEPEGFWSYVGIPGTNIDAAHGVNGLFRALDPGGFAKDQVEKNKKDIDDTVVRMGNSIVEAPFYYLWKNIRKSSIAEALKDMFIKNM